MTFESPPPAVIDFAGLVRGFCTWCEGESLGPSPERQAAAWLCRLYAAALALPQVGGDYSEEFPEPSAMAEANAKRNLSPFMGHYYRECFDPDPLLDDEPCMGDIGDDLTDTYDDLRRGLAHFDKGQVAEALWHWSFMHQIHWGRHAVGAIFGLHCLEIARN